MNQINANDLLSQIRTLGRDLQPTQQPQQPPTAEFGDMLKTTLNAVNDAKQHASELQTSFLNGTSDKTLAEVVIASQKADLSFRAVTEVRNKLVTAYQDIMNMPV